MAVKKGEPREEETQKNALDYFWSFFSSMRVGIVLLLILTVMSVYGATFLLHQEALEKVYRSWWFIGTLVLTGLNLLVCSINRFESIWRRATILRTEVTFKGLSQYKTQGFVRLDDVAKKDAAEEVKGLLAKKGYRTALTVKDDGVLVSADKGRFGYFGSLVTHLSLILLLLGGLQGIMSGFESFDGGFPGREFAVSETGFSVVIDDFEISYRDDGSIEQYYSTLTIMDEGEAAKQETIYVNRPLRYKGVALYQSTYGWGVDVDFIELDTGEVSDAVTLRAGQVYQHQDTGLQLYIIDFYPDFTMTDMGIPFSRSSFPANPRVAYSIYNAEGHIVGQQYYIERLENGLEFAEGFIVEFTGYRNYTGFQIMKNPGKPLALFASLLMIVGLLMSFYLFPRRVWAYMGPEVEGKVLIAGQSHRNKVGFDLEFERLIKQINDLREGKKNG